MPLNNNELYERYQEIKNENEGLKSDIVKKFEEDDIKD